MNQEDRDILQELIKYNKERIGLLQEHYETLNYEMGCVQGELRWIKWLIVAVVGGIIAEIIIPYIL